MEYLLISTKSVPSASRRNTDNAAKVHTRVHTTLRPHFPNALYTACFWPSRWVWGAQQVPAMLEHENGRSWLTITILCCSSLHLWGKMGTIEGGMKMPSKVWIIPFEATMSRMFKGIPDSSIRILPWCRNTILVIKDQLHKANEGNMVHNIKGSYTNGQAS